MHADSTDRSKADPTAGPAEAELEVGPVGRPSFDVRKHEHRLRGVLAVGFLLLLALTVAASLLITALGSPQAVSDTKDLLDVLIPTESALLGSVVGFYFGTRS